MKRRRATHVVTQGDAPSDGATTPPGEHAAAGPQFPYGMHNPMATYASSTNIDVGAYEDLPGHHLLAVRNLIATTNDESYQGSASELPSHGYAEWDFSSVPDPVLFQRFLDARTTGLATPTTPASEAMILHASASWSLPMNMLTVQTEQGQASEMHPKTRGQARPHLANGRHRHQHAAGPSARARGQARGRVPAGATPACHHHRRSLGANAHAS
jgi:hypothetical protein